MGRLGITVVVAVVVAGLAILSQYDGTDSVEVFREIASRINVKVVLPGESDPAIGPNDTVLRVHDVSCISQILRDENLGFGESYMDGKWTTNDLVGVYEKIFMHRQLVENYLKGSWKIIWHLFRNKFLDLNSITRSRDVARVHYDLGVNLYENMLGPTMQYTCGHWKPGTLTLEDAQLAKLRLLAGKLRLPEAGSPGPRLRVLDIGCGFGTLARFLAANYHVRVVGITLSVDQAAWAREHYGGGEGNVEVRVVDYRHVNETFDRVVSVGMMEHVGVKQIRVYFQKAYDSLPPGGIFLLHTIGSQKPMRNADAFFDKYIFPGANFPFLADVAAASGDLFLLEDLHNFGPSYAKTLAAWRVNFVANAARLEPRYRDPKFDRMWHIYLAQCVAIFRTRSLQLWQMVLVKQDIRALSVIEQADWARLPYDELLGGSVSQLDVRAEAAAQQALPMQVRG